MRLDIRYSKHLLELRRLAWLLIATGLMVGCATDPLHGSREGLYTFYLRGGHFYGPGPVVPDTPLTSGRLINIHFDLNEFRGYAEFYNDGASKSKLSDGRTRINQNIDAGHLYVGGSTNAILLVAVDGGPHGGTETYALDDEYRFVWRVDLALDSGFEEGIIRINDFILHTGVVSIAPSLQTRRGIPGGYDQAGTLKSDSYLAGRVGDFDQDGFLDGVLVAAPNVPMGSDMLPGAPVGNQRGFTTNIPLPPHLSCDLILRGAVMLQTPTQTLLGARNLTEAQKLLDDFNGRIKAAQRNVRRALNDKTAWGGPTLYSEGQDIATRLDAMAVVIGRLATTHEPNPSTATISAVTHTLNTVFSDLQRLVADVAGANRKMGTTLPQARAPMMPVNPMTQMR